MTMNNDGARFAGGILIWLCRGRAPGRPGNFIAAFRQNTAPTDAMFFAGAGLARPQFFLRRCVTGAGEHSSPLQSRQFKNPRENCPHGRPDFPGGQSGLFNQPCLLGQPCLFGQPFGFQSGLFSQPCLLGQPRFFSKPFSFKTLSFQPFGLTPLRFNSGLFGGCLLGRWRRRSWLRGLLCRWLCSVPH